MKTAKRLVQFTAWGALAKASVTDRNVVSFRGRLPSTASRRAAALPRRRASAALMPASAGLPDRSCRATNLKFRATVMMQPTQNVTFIDARCICRFRKSAGRMRKRGIAASARRTGWQRYGGGSMRIFEVQ